MASISDKAKQLDELYRATVEADTDVKLAFVALEIARHNFSQAINRREGLKVLAREIARR